MPKLDIEIEDGGGSVAAYLDFPDKKRVMLVVYEDVGEDNKMISLSPQNAINLGGFLDRLGRRIMEEEQ